MFALEPARNSDSTQINIGEGKQTSGAWYARVRSDQNARLFRFCQNSWFGDNKYEMSRLCQTDCLG